MAYCSNCGAQMNDDATFCTQCGAPVGYTAPQGQPAPEQQGQPYGNYQQYYVDPSDHTAEFDPADISENKVYCLAAYLMGIPGMILALLAAPNSKYAAFHARQALKLHILTILVTLVSLLLCWTVIVPIAGGICGAILVVLQIICFFQVCSGKAKDCPLIGNLGFLK